MKLRTIVATGMVCMLLTLSIPVVRAEITDFSASVEAEVNEYLSGDAAGVDRASESYPGTSLDLPIHAFARIVTGVEDVEGVGLAAGMFSDPREASGRNPQELALNLILNGLESDVSYGGRVLINERRRVVFHRADFPLVTGERVDVEGQVFLDGVLLLFAREADADLSGAVAELEVTVLQVDDEGEHTAMWGGITLTGQAGGAAQLETRGAIAERQLLRTNLSAFVSDFGTFEAVIIPRITINYAYRAPLEQPFDLTVRVVARGRNLSGSDGVGVVLGAPMQHIQDVIDLVNGKNIGEKAVSALQAERDRAAGISSFDNGVFGPLLPACGMLSLESVLGVVALVGLSGYRSRRAR